MAAKTIADLSKKDMEGKLVLMRVDFNVPLKDGRITDDTRIKAALPSIQTILDSGGRLVLMSHLGRPSGEGFEAKFSLRPAAEKLAEHLGKEVKLGPCDVVGPEAREMSNQLKTGEVMLLENVRFNSAETTKDALDMLAFGAELGSLGEVYVNDAFGTCHRKHASMYGCPQAVRDKGGRAVAGLLVEKEIKYLHDAVATPRRPFLAILGGAKVADKIKLVRSLLEKTDKIIIGGAMAYTFLKARGETVGKSRIEEDQVVAMQSLLSDAGDAIVLPCDHICSESFESDEAVAVDDVNIPENLMGMDIGPNTREVFGEVIAASKTIVWNGPMGVFERTPFAGGTRAVAEQVARATDSGAVSIIGGGDSAAAVQQMNLSERMTHVSTGGGASLSYLENKPMPPIEVLDQK